MSSAANTIIIFVFWDSRNTLIATSKSANELLLLRLCVGALVKTTCQFSSHLLHCFCTLQCSRVSEIVSQQPKIYKSTQADNIIFKFTDAFFAFFGWWEFFQLRTPQTKECMRSIIESYFLFSSGRLNFPITIFIVFMCHIAAQRWARQRHVVANAIHDSRVSPHSANRQRRGSEYFFVGGRERKKHIKKSEFKKVRHPPKKQNRGNKKISHWACRKAPQQKILILEPACDALGKASRNSQLVYDIYNFFSYILMRYSTARGYSQPEEGERVRAICYG